MVYWSVMATMASTNDAPDRALASVDALESAFRRMSQLAKRHIHRISEAIHPELRQAGWAVLGLALRACAEGRQTTVGEIVALTGMDKSVVSRQVRSLKDWGLVELSRSATDARVVVVEPTEEAKQRFEAVRQQQRDIYAEVLKDWTPEEAKQLEVLLSKLAEAVID